MTEDDSGIGKAADDAAEALDGALPGDAELTNALDTDGDLASGGTLDAAADVDATDVSDAVAVDDVDLAGADVADGAADVSGDIADGAADDVADAADSISGTAAAAGAGGVAAAGAAAGKAKKQIRTSADAPKIEAKPKKERGYGGNNKRTLETDGAGDPKPESRKAKTDKGDKDKSSSAVKKVARAAETGNSRDLSMSSRLGFPAIVGLICILGLLLVTYARINREAEVKPVQNRDHWHAVYGVYDCTLNDGDGGYLPPFLSTDDEVGIHSHQDGIMHIHPWYDRSDGPEAQVSVFLEAMNVEIDDESITLDTGAVLQEGADCGGEEAVVHLRKWTFDFQVENEDPEIFTEDISSVRFLNDREVYIIAFAPLDAEIPSPPAERFETLGAVSQALLSDRPDDVVIDAEEDITFDVGPVEETDTGE